MINNGGLACEQTARGIWAVRGSALRRPDRDGTLSVGRTCHWDYSEATFVLFRSREPCAVRILSSRAAVLSKFAGRASDGCGQFHGVVENT